MNARATVLRVLDWAAEPRGRPPTGPLWDVGSLASPSPAIHEATAQLAWRTAALLGAGPQPFGAEGRVGLGVVFLAAAVGGRRQVGSAITLAQAVPPPKPRRAAGAWYDLLARHGLVGTVLAALRDDGAGQPDQAQVGDEQALADALLDASPLSAVLHRPALHAIKSGATGQAVSTAVELLDRPRGAQVLATGLAGWVPFPDVLTWRTELLNRLRIDHRDLLLDVYLVARLRFGADWDERVSWAGRKLASRGAPDPLAIATLRFWVPLATLAKTSTPLPALRPLLTGHDRALHLVRRFHLDQAGAA